jgi:hypothetical protein
MEPKHQITEAQRAAESRRILASINDEMQVSGLGNRISNHFTASDADQNDKVEVLGRRIGRVLSLALCIGLIIWLASFIMRNAA